MMRPSSTTAWGSVPLLLVVCLANAPAAAAPTVTENPAAAPQSETVVLQELWRAGGENDEDVLLGQIGNAAVDSEARLYALDTQLNQVLVFGPDGVLQGTLGREGDGPGEMRRPIGLDVRDDGVIAVMQPFPGKIIYLDPAGNPAGEFSLGGNDPAQGGLGMIRDARQRAGRLVVAGQRSSFDLDNAEIRDERFLAEFTSDASEVHRFAEITATRNLDKMVFDELAEFHPGDRGRWDLGPDGRLYANSRYDSYEITVYALDASPERVITRPHEARRRTEAEIEELQSGMRININGREPEIEQVIQDNAPCVDRLHVLADGTVWVVNSHGRDRWDDEGIVVYDVFDAEGRLVKEVEVTVPGGGEEHRLILLDDGRFLLALGMADLSISIEAGSGDGLNQTEAPDVTIVPELVCFAAP